MRLSASCSQALFSVYSGLRKIAGPFIKFFSDLGCQIAVSMITPAKGRRTITRLCGCEGRGENENSYEQRVQNQFGGFCTRVLKNEANRILNEYARQRDREKSLDELSPDELAQAASYDKYFQDEYVFEVLGQKVFVVGDLLAEALSQLPEDKRDVILLSYFLGMTDREISEQLNVVRQAISKRRSGILKELREYLEKEGFEWPET